MASGGGPGRMQQWLLVRAPEVLVLVGVVVFAVGGVIVLLTNPPTNLTGADEQYGPDAPIQGSNVLLALVMFAAAVGLLGLLGWRLWRRATTNGY